MHVTRLDLSGFRSHRRTRIEVDARPVAIFGPNGAGKTNLIEALSLLSPGRGLRRAAAADLTRHPADLGWRVGAELVAGGETREVETRAAPGQPRAVRIDAKAASQADLGRLLRVLWLVPAMDRLWIEGAEGRRRFLDRMTMSLRPGHAEAALAYDKAMRERNRLLRDDVRDPAWYRALEARMAAAGAEIAHGRAAAVAQVMAAQEAVRTGFPISDLSLRDPEGAPPLSAEALAAGRERDRAAGRSLVGPHRADLEAVYRAKGVAAASCSTGEQKALLISLILANARALKAQIGAAPVLLLDEVAAHLDAGRRAALYDEIGALGCQAWMTGTGAGLFDDLGARAQRLSVTEGAAAEGSLVVPA